MHGNSAHHHKDVRNRNLHGLWSFVVREALSQIDASVLDSQIGHYGEDGSRQGIKGLIEWLALGHAIELRHATN